MPHDRFLKAMNAAHRVLQKATFNRLGHTFMNMPSLELTTIGRKSGRPHAVMLTAPVVEGDTFVVVASRGGDPQHPAWFLNLRDNPDVEVSVQGGPKQRMRARVADAQERARLWPKVTADHKNYADYQKRTTREIPLVLLEPA
jgi:deazaflavin-dependent oxidoreductase (nitroreductase family)